MARDYISLTDSFSAVTDGIARAQKLRQLQMQTEAYEFQLRQQQQQSRDEIESQQLMMQMMNNPGTTDQDWLKFSMRYPTKAKQVQEWWKQRDEVARRADIAVGVQALNAMRAGDQETAAQLLRQAEQAAANSGTQSAFTGLSDIIKHNPTVGEQAIAFSLMNADPKRMEQVYKAMTAQSAASHADQLNDAKVYGAQAHAMGLEQDALRKGLMTQDYASGNVPTTGRGSGKSQAGTAGFGSAPWNGGAVQKYFMELDREIKDSQMRSFELENAATAMEQAGGRPDGIWGSITGVAKRMFGEEDDVSALNAWVEKLKNQEALKRLPKGPASDKDVGIAMRGLPDAEKSNSAYLASWLRGMAKLERYSAAFKQLDRQFAMLNGNKPGAALSDFELPLPGGKKYHVKAGTYFEDLLADNEVASLVFVASSPFKNTATAPSRNADIDLINRELKARRKPKQDKVSLGAQFNVGA